MIKKPEFDLKVINHQGEEYKGNTELVETLRFPLMKFPFTYFNPMQSEFFPLLAKEDVNYIINTPTSSGKTVLIELLTAREIHKGKKSIYIAPLKALSNQVYSKWIKPGHDFSSKKISILTGDYVKDDKKVAELKEADIIIMTPEMLDVSLRKDNKSDSFCLVDIGVLIVDEAHLIGEEGRGDKLESCLMRFSKVFPDSKIALISATMPNLDQLKSWLEYLTNREAILFKSNYRPARLDLHFLCIGIKGKVTPKKEQEIRMGLTSELVRSFKGDSILVFVGSKSFGRKLIKRFEEEGISKVFFFNADLPIEVKDKALEDFDKKEIEILVSTSALAWGLNTPARRVVVAQQAYSPFDEFSTATNIQMAGRGGRPPYELLGDCYFLLTSKYEYNMDRIINGEALKSQMLDVRLLSFHILSEIRSKEIWDRDSLMSWYKRSFAYYQDPNSLTMEAIDLVFEKLLKYRMVIQYLDENKDVRYKTSFLGDLTASFYLYPDDANALILNMEQYLKHNSYMNNDRDSDLHLAYALAKIPSNFEGNYLNADDIDEIHENIGTVSKDYLEKYTMSYYLCLHSEHEVTNLMNTVSQLRQDIRRVMSFFKLYNSYYKSMNLTEKDFEKLYIRIKYGCGIDLVELCSIKGVGYTLARRLKEGGIHNKDEFFKNMDVVKAIVGNRVK